MGAVDRSVPVYPIGIVQKLAGLSGRQIRYYEQQGLLAPERTKGNQRLYSPQDVDRLVRIKELLAQGLTLDGVRQHLDTPIAESTGSTGTPVPHLAIDHEHLITQMRSGTKIASLYPVRNQAALVQLLEARRAIKEQNDAAQNGSVPKGEKDA